MSDQQNTVLAIVLSILVIVAFEFLYFAPQREAMEAYVAQQEAAQTEAAIEAGDAPATPEAGDAPGLTGEAPSLPGATVGSVATGASREDSLDATARIEVLSPRLKGSISVEGGRIDDITLVDYRETIDPESPQIILLSPQGSQDAYFTEFGWIGSGSTMPDRNSIWRADSSLLTPDQPVTLEWDNGEGLLFSRRIELDDEYMFTVTQRPARTRASTGCATCQSGSRSVRSAR